MFITSFGEQNITYKCCSNFLIHLYIAYAFELDSIEFYLPSKSKFKITATRKLVGVPETKFYTGDFDKDNIAQFHMAFDCSHKTIQILDFMIGDKNNGELKYKSDKKSEVMKATGDNDLAMLNLVCENAKAIK
ncbi:hypothetical protein [Acinetobacter nosocomialis]|uniref:hypothetical protein n=2 Tax=Acinetobacter nosocomialis TaxID=106654 RepID=UPI002B499AA4|nr:hypothetical protein [Acinetobacter nosocomialis]